MSRAPLKRLADGTAPPAGAEGWLVPAAGGGRLYMQGRSVSWRTGADAEENGKRRRLCQVEVVLTVDAGPDNCPVFSARLLGDDSDMGRSLSSTPPQIDADASTLLRKVKGILGHSAAARVSAPDYFMAEKVTASFVQVCSRASRARRRLTVPA